MATDTSLSSSDVHPAKRARVETAAADDLSGGELSSEELETFRSEGFLVYRGLLSGEEVASVRQNILKLIDNWYDEYEKTGFEDEDWKSVVNRDPDVKSGKLVTDDRYLSVRRLFRMALHDKFFKQLSVNHPKIKRVSQQIIGDDVKLLQSMALLKPPGTAEKRWHQDNAYFRLVPNDVSAFWIAIDQARVDNGCMHVVPRSHKHGIDEHSSPSGMHQLYSLKNLPQPSTVKSIPLEPGDALIFHGALQHYTPPNQSKDTRYAVQLHYASGKCQPTVCPKSSDGESEEDDGDKQTPVFDCDPCVEPKFWYYRKAELLVSGKDYGDPFI